MHAFVKVHPTLGAHGCAKASASMYGDDDASTQSHFSPFFCLFWDASNDVMHQVVISLLLVSR